MAEPPADVPVGPADETTNLLRWSEALAGIARTGLGFVGQRARGGDASARYEAERYEEILKVAADMRVHAEEAVEAVEVRREQDHFVQEWLGSVREGVPGYVTPKVAVGAVVGNDQGQLLLVQRADSGVWLYPTGWADIGYSPAEVALKEVAEETGIEAEAVRLLAVLDGYRMGMRLPLYSLVFHCRAVGGSLRTHPLETSDVGWFTEDDLPWPVIGWQQWGELAMRAVRGEAVETMFDEPRASVWRGTPQGPTADAVMEEAARALGLDREP
jgi:ADP-ribose pyrophosphatase YjhB (NUDIX family)